MLIEQPRRTVRHATFSVCFATAFRSSGVSVYDTDAEARLHAAQKRFSLPCGQGLQSAQSRFSFPCGQGLQSAQLSFRLPCGHRFTPITSPSRLRQGSRAPLASSRPVPRVVNASPRRKEASAHKQAFHAFGLRLASGFRIFACVGGVFLGSIAIHRDGTSSRASSATGPHSAHDVVGGSRHRPRARRGRAR